MTKDGVRDFIAAEYTLSENYVHGLVAVQPKFKKNRKPAFLHGLKAVASRGKFRESAVHEHRVFPALFGRIVAASHTHTLKTG